MSMQLWCDQEAQWASVSRATQLEARCRSERARDPRHLRLRVGVWLVRAGLHLAGPSTVKRMLDPS